MSVPSEYAGKVVLVTGSRRGVGKLIAEHFLAAGATVLGFARGAAAIEHPSYHHFEVDVGDTDAVVRAFGEVKKVTDSIQIVINNAAVLTSQYAMIMPPAAAQAMVNVNLLGPFMVSREAAKMMRKRKWGRIINIGSMAASLEPMGDSMYAACKAGLSTLANVMAKEFAAMNVTCNTLAINAIDSDMLSQLPRDKIDAIIAGLPVPRFSQPDDILNVIDFFAAERSSIITAQTVFLGGVN
ncbi:SDR family NAD(P)-dependent oxidoreductase [Massilia sp. Leaf139]|uniref:SDR family NAD(P)-dependent oxidoreductase n=1 Tax=Massilia sp. Leaf139 TaxID=1736272 RepID=UPI0006FF205F|nr:SDR family NAD(P)-dependent oxidoreductase [Massilia sp. Leaf139]KQQ94948.1 oxidoreductase [Massilia sp. Leaf139]